MQLSRAGKAYFRLSSFFIVLKGKSQHRAKKDKVTIQNQMFIFHWELGYGGYLEGFWLRHKDINLSIHKKTRNALRQ